MTNISNRNRKWGLSRALRSYYARFRISVGYKPLSYKWGVDRGLPIPRYYMEQFMAENKGDIRGHCLEFQEDTYTSAFGQGNVTKLDLLHHDESNPQATIVADLTKPNSIPSDTYDCIVCTMVLNMIYDFPAAIRDLHRILKPGGVLLATVPHLAMYHPDAHGLWRFTPEGFSLSLSTVFGNENMAIHSCGNSLCAAAEMRGVVSEELPESLLNQKDEYFPVTICARVIKAV